MDSEAQKNTKKKYYRVHLDFYPCEAALWEHLQGQSEKQTYIKGLIRADMEATMKADAHKQMSNYIDMRMRMERGK